MNAAENIENLIKKFCETKRASVATSDEMDKKVLNDALAVYEKSNNTTSVAKPLNIWRIIMKSRITKLAAAMMIVAILIAVNMLEGTPVWAIEDTARVLEEYNGIYISGVANVPLDKFGGGDDLVIKEGQEMSVEIWAQANEERTSSGNIKMRTGDGAIGAVYNNATYIYDPGKNTVEISSCKSVQISPWPNAEFLVKAQEFMEDWQVLYGKDAATGRDYAFVKCSNSSQNQSWWLEIDLETNLPVRVKGWNNTRHEGAPAMDFQRIVFFGNLLDEMFEFKTPKGAHIVDLKQSFKEMLSNPDYGVSMEGLTKHQAGRKIVEGYWQAMINEDWEKARKLRGIPEGYSWDSWRAQYYNNMPAEIVDIPQPYEGEYGLTVPMTIKMVNGDIKKGRLMIKFYQLNGLDWCIIKGNYGPRELNPIDN